MRTVNFRDSVLWAIAYKLGLDPAVELLTDQANALASYINSWVRRLWDASDWPEWAFTYPYEPDLTHIVLWDDEPSEPVPHTGGIGRVLKVYLVDPNTTWAPVDTPFRLNDQGIHCGFEHGTNVWIKFLARCPQYTADAWDASTSYGNGQLTYSPRTGECYMSKSGNNLGNDPAAISGGIHSSPLQPETILPWLLPAQSEQIKLSLTVAQVVPGSTYTLTFIGVDSMEHTVSYVALATDGPEEILTGLMAAVTTAGVTDPFLAEVDSFLDSTAPSVTFTIGITLGNVSLDAVVVTPGSAFWDLVPFPFALVDQVVRGAYADALGEQGQTDKQAPQEAAVPMEQTVRVDTFRGHQFAPLTDQQVARDRYGQQNVPAGAPAGGGK